MLVLLIAIAATGDLSSMDLYKINCMDLHTTICFEYKAGFISMETVSSGEAYTTTDFGFNPDPTQTVNGKWSAYGSTEYLLNEPLDEIVKASTADHLKTTGKVSGIIHYFPRCEIITDGDLLAFTDLHPGNIELAHSVDTPVFIKRKSPIIRHEGASIWEYINKKFSMITPKKSLLNQNREFPVESFNKKKTTGWLQFEIVFNASKRSTPWHTRLIDYNDRKDEAVVKEEAIIDAHQSSLGGFVPSRWVELYYRVGSFQRLNPNYQPGDNIKSVSKRSFCGILESTQISDQPTTSLEKLNLTNSISSYGKRVAIGFKPSSLSLDSIKTVFAKQSASKLMSKNDRAKFIPALTDHLDKQEQAKFNNSKTNFDFVYLGFVVLGLILVFGLFLKLKRFFFSAFIILIPCLSTGCYKHNPPSPKISAAMKEAFVVITSDPIPSNLTLKIMNSGNIPIDLFAVDGGCTCRSVDQSGLPATLEPGAIHEAPVAMALKAQYERQKYIFNFQTSKGLLSAELSVQAIPLHSVEPESLSNTSLTEDSDWTFEIMHRSLNSGPNVDVFLAVPPSLKIISSSKAKVKLEHIESLTFNQTKYIINLIDRSLGVNKTVAEVRLSEGLHPIVAELPILWRRQPYLTSSPEKVILSSSPVNVKLVCQANNVFITKIVSIPVGLSAFLDTPRSIVISLNDPDIPFASGALTIETNSPTHPLFSIPVISKH